jgi:RNA polymerase sigma factor (sigma-70 family)
MKDYDEQNFNRFKKDIENTLGIDMYNIVEKIARKFNTSNESSGVMTLEDLMQEGFIGLFNALKLVDETTILNSPHPEKTFISFVSKRIKGSIRRAIDSNRSSIRIPEHKINDLRNNPEDNELLLLTYLNNTFVSLSDAIDDEGSTYADIIEDQEEEYKKDMLMERVKEVLSKYLTKREMTVLMHSYGIDCEKLPAKEIASIIGLNGKSAYVRVSEIKKEAMDKLIKNMTYSEVSDLL